MRNNLGGKEEINTIPDGVWESSIPGKAPDELQSELLNMKNCKPGDIGKNCTGGDKMCCKGNGKDKVNQHEGSIKTDLQGNGYWE